MHAMRSFRRTLAALSVAATTTLAACSDSTGPSVDAIDTETAAARIAPIAAVFEQSAFEALVGAGDYFAAAPVGGLSAVSKMTASLRSGRTGDASALMLARSTAAVVSAEVVPAEIQGSTWVYSTAVAGYVLDENATGAPANGFRIVLYAWDVLSGAPAQPLSRIGYVDLTDQSTASTNALRVRLVRDQGAATLADYVISHTTNASGESFGINGSASNATTTVNFTLNGSVTGAEGAERVTAGFELSVPAAGYSIGLETSLDLGLERLTSNLEIAYDGHSLTVDETATVTATGGSVQGEVRYDGALYATYTTTYNENTGVTTNRFVKANGDALSQVEIARLAALFERAFDVGDFWGGLLWPVYAFQ